jgi:hypothetical protein
MTKQDVVEVMQAVDTPAGHFSLAVTLLCLGVVLGLVLTLTGHSEGRLVLTGAGSALLLRLKS